MRPLALRPTVARVLLAVASAACLTLPLAAHAQQERGDKEVGLGGSFQVTQPKGGGGSSLQGSVTATLGLFATRNLKLTVGTSLNASGSAGGGGGGEFDEFGELSAVGGGGDTQTSGLLIYGASYYFGGAGARTYPYVGVGGGTTFSSAAGARSATNVNGFAGLQHFFNRRASLFVQGDYIPSDAGSTLLNTFGFRVVF